MPALEGQTVHPRRPRRTTVLLGAVAAAAVLVGGAVVLDRGSTDQASGPLPPLEFDAGVGHVHGLGVDPADGVLYAATHSGLFRLPEQGSATRVANRAQDTMGFAVIGPGTFLGSGHPDLREDDVRPPLLGLIESTDAGERWARLSLHGQADFHVLRQAHGRVYGYDSTSQTLMVSTDRESWDKRAHLLVRDFVVSPSDPDLVLATVERGSAVSRDGGRTFTPLAAPPGLAVLAWVEPSRLYGIAVDGTVHRSEDGGQTWTRRGKVGGEPEAVAVDSRNGEETLYVAVYDDGVLASTDGGATFTTRFRQRP